MPHNTDARDLTHQCIACGLPIPHVSRYCAFCGHSQVGSSPEAIYRIQPTELVTQLSVISTLMPLTNRQSANHYRWAVVLSAVAMLTLLLTGFLPAAVAGGSVLLPAAYLAYLGEARFWITGSALRGMLGVVVTPAVLGVAGALLITHSDVGRLVPGLLLGARGMVPPSAFIVATLLVAAVAIALTVLVAASVGPLLLARLPEFDDMLDAFSLGAAAGLVVAAAETLATSRDLYFVHGLQVADPAPWVPVVLHLMLVKPIVYALATGLAVSAFAGLGRGYRGFTSSYWRALGGVGIILAMFWFGSIIVASSTAGPVLVLVWGVVIATVLVLETRVTLQSGLMEKSIQRHGFGRTPLRDINQHGDCDECDMPLVPDAFFCASCGVATEASVTGRGERFTQLALTRRAPPRPERHATDDAP